MWGVGRDLPCFRIHWQLTTDNCSPAPLPLPPAGNWVRFSCSIRPSFVLSHNISMINTTGKLASFRRFSNTASSLSSHYLATGHCPYSLATRYSPLATCHPPYPTPSSATRNWVPLACVTCYEMLRFSAFSRFWKLGFRRKFLLNRWLWLVISRPSFDDN